MIISHKYKYLFVQNARTASTSIGKELCQCYDGEKILQKHSPYSDFLKSAADEEKRYFAFTGQRNPLDELVTLFFRAKYQNLAKIENEPKLAYWNGRAQARRFKIWKYVSENDLTFVQFFNRYHSFWISRPHLKIEREKINFVYRYENLQQDFSTILKKIGVVQKRKLPQHSMKTLKKDPNFIRYYTPEIQCRVQIVFGESFKSLGYDFPADWPKPGLIDYYMYRKDWLLKGSADAMRYLFPKALG